MEWLEESSKGRARARENAQVSESVYTSVSVSVSVCVFVYLFGKRAGGGERGRRATNAAPQTISQLALSSE